MEIEEKLAKLRTEWFNAKTRKDQKLIEMRAKLLKRVLDKKRGNYGKDKTLA